MSYCVDWVCWLSSSCTKCVIYVIIRYCDTYRSRQTTRLWEGIHLQPVQDCLLGAGVTHSCVLFRDRVIQPHYTKTKIYVVFLLTVWVALKRASLACKLLWNKPVVWLGHSRCSKWCPFAFTYARSCVCHWSVALSMIPWGIRSQLSML